MPKRKKSRGVRGRKPARVLWALFLAGTAARFLLAVLFKINPTIQPDESLYINIAKSLYGQGEILFRGQPTNYAYLLYPFVLLPLYAFLPVGIDLFRAGQFVNACLISSVVFPAYYAAKEITGSHERSLMVAVITLLLPDMAMSAFIMSESLVYALYFACFYVIVLAVKRGKFQYYALTGVLGALMYYTKNFHILLAAVFLALALVASLFEKRFREALYALIGGALLFGVSAGLMAISKYVFHLVAPTYNINTAGDIVSGLGNMLSNIPLYAEGFAMYAAFFTIALGGACFAMPAFNLRAYTRDNRLIALTIGGALTAVTVTVLYVIHPGTRTGAFMARVELRYLSMYLAPLIALSLAKELDGRRLNVFGVGWLALAAVYSAALGLGNGLEYAHVDNHALAILAPRFIGDVFSRVFSVALAAPLALLAAYLLIKGWTRFAKRAALIFLIALYASSNVAAYQLNTYHNIERLRVDSLEMAQVIDAVDGDVLMITKEHFVGENLMVDSRTKTVLNSVIHTELMKQLLTSKGTYIPFMPTPIKNTIPDRELVDASMLVFDSSSWLMFQFMPDIKMSIAKNGYFVYALVNKGEPSFASVFVGLPFERTLRTEDGKSAICAFDAAARDENGLLHIFMRVISPRDNVKLHIGDETVLLSAGENSVRAAVEAGGDFPKYIFVYADAPGVDMRKYEVLYE